MANYIALSEVQVDQDDVLYKAMAHIKNMALEMSQFSVYLRKQGRTEVAREVSSFVAYLDNRQSMFMFAEKDYRNRIANESEPVEF